MASWNSFEVDYVEWFDHLLPFTRLDMCNSWTPIPVAKPPAEYLTLVGVARAFEVTLAICCRLSRDVIAHDMDLIHKLKAKGGEVHKRAINL